MDIGSVGGLLEAKEYESLLYPRIKKQAKSVLGIDVNEEGIKALKARGENVVCANAETYVANPPVDVVVMGAVLEHMDNPGLAIDCAWKSLKKDGELIITVGNARYFGIAWNGKVALGHKFLFAPNNLKNLLDAHGFRVVDIQNFRPEGSTNAIGWLYERLFLKLRPQNSLHFGVLAKKVEL